MWQKAFLSFVSILYSLTGCIAQELSLDDLEKSFVLNNQSLFIEKFNISKAEAHRMQAKVWDNPSFELSEVNLWTNQTVEQGIKQQYAIELQQLIETAGKRKSRIQIKAFEKKDAEYAYLELLFQLKSELHKAFYTARALYQQEEVNKQIEALYRRQTEKFKKHVDAQHISKADYLRIQAALLSLQRENLLLHHQQLEIVHQIAVLTQIPQLTFDSLNLQATAESNLEHNYLSGIDQKLANNIQLLRKANNIEIARANWSLEHANRIPNLQLIINNDRGGNIMRNFVGVGLSFDIPLFDRNKQHIKAARLELTQQEAHAKQVDFELRAELSKLINQLSETEKTLLLWSENLKEDQSEILEIYQRNLMAGQISLIQFIDYIESFKDARTAYIELHETYQHQLADLKLLIGPETPIYEN
ncbi:MAG: TolC family protein [Sphingobacterium hotanense]